MHPKIASWAGARALLVLTMFASTVAPAILVGCGDDDPAPAPAKPGLGIDAAPEAQVVGEVDFAEPVTTTVAAGPYVFALYAAKDCGILDLTDPELPIDRGRVETPSRVVAVAYDDAHQLAYLAGEGGEVIAVDLAFVGQPRKVAELSVSSLGGGGATDLVRSGDRLFALAGNTLQPLGVTREPGGGVSLALQAPVTLPEPATRIAAGAGQLYLGDASGKLAVMSAPAGSGAPQSLGEIQLGGAVRGIVAKGSKILAVGSGVGLKAFDMAEPSSARVLFETSEVADATEARLHGKTLLLGLERGAFTTIDVSDVERPRAITTNKGELPAWIAISRGHLFFGGATKGSVAGVPPYLTGLVSGPARTSFPLRGLIPATLSKTIDPAAVTPSAVTLSCGGATVAGTPVLAFDRRTVLFQPSAELPPGVDCALDLSGLRDPLGLSLAAGQGRGAYTFTTSAAPPAPVTHNGSSHPHTVDGGFTDWTGEGDGPFEWFDVPPAKGRYTYFYADYDGTDLWILNDWFYNGDSIDPDCYNQFVVWTGGGSEQWEVRAYGDQRVEVRKNGELVDAESEGVEGGASYGPSPNQEEPHTMYEIRLPASPGGWGVQLHDPGPTFGCAQLEQEPSPMTGELSAGGGSTTTTLEIVDATAPGTPALVLPADGAEVAQPVSLSWSQTGDGIDFSVYEVQIATQPDFALPSRVFDAVTYGTSITLADGQLVADTVYYWHVIAWTNLGSATSDARSFSVPGGGGSCEPDPGDACQTCAVSECPSEAEACCAINGCLDILACAITYGCSGVACYSAETCKAIIDAHGGPLDDAATAAGALGSCAFASCQACGGGGGGITDAWSKQFDGGASYLYVTTTANTVDGLGRSLLTGNFSGDIDFGAGAMTSLSPEYGDIFVAALDANGDHLWSKQFGDDSFDYRMASDIATDGSGNVVFAGDFSGQIDFGGGALTSANQYSPDGFLVKLSASGAHVWSKSFGVSGGQLMVRGVAVDGGGDIVMTGSFITGADFGGGALTSAGQSDVFVARFDASGNHLWSMAFGSAGQEAGSAITVDAGGNVYVVGSFASTIDFGGGVLTSAGSNDVFVLKLAASGDHVWSVRLGDEASQTAAGVVVDAGGDLVVAGFGLLLTKLDATGSVVWNAPASGSVFPRGVTLDGQGNVVVAGYFSGSADLGGGALTSAGSSDVFIATYGTAGDHLDSRAFGDAANQTCSSIAGAGSHVVVIGDFQGSIDFGAGALSVSTGNAAFAASLASPPGN